MSRSPGDATAEVALRPWPFGPPLRGRALRGLGGRWAATIPSDSTRSGAALPTHHPFDCPL